MKYRDNEVWFSLLWSRGYIPTSLKSVIYTCATLSTDADLMDAIMLLVYFVPLNRRSNCARRCPLYTTEPETPSDVHLCKAVTKNNQLTTKPLSRALIQSQISLRGKRTGADETSLRHFLHAGRHQRLLLLEFSHTCSMVRYIILRKHLLLMPPIIAFRNKSSSARFLQREGHLRHVKHTPRLAPC